MTLILRFACLSCLISTLSFAESLSGWLVNSECFSSLEGNRGDVPSYVNWDENRAIRYCSPTQKTKSFASCRKRMDYHSNWMLLEMKGRSTLA